MGNRVNTEFGKRFRSLEIEVINDSDNTLITGDINDHRDYYFFTGAVHRDFERKVIGPGESSVALVANEESAPTGVTGGLRMKIKLNKSDPRKDQYYLVLGFTNPLIGKNKNYITITTSEAVDAESGYDNAKNGDKKSCYIDGFKVQSETADPKEGGDMRMQYTVGKDYRPVAS